MDRFKMIASSYLLLVIDGKILLSRRFKTGYEDGKYSLPAGHIEDNESLTAGGAREIFEEIGIRIKPKDLTLVHVMHRKKDDIRMDFFFTPEIGDQKPIGIAGGADGGRRLAAAAIARQGGGQNPTPGGQAPTMSAARLPKPKRFFPRGAAR